MTQTQEPAGGHALSGQTLLLVDGSSYLYRAYHAMPDLRADPLDPTSPPTGAIRGMINMLGSLRQDFPEAQYVACVFDASGKTFRDDLYAAYKANRSPMPDDLRAQIEPINTVVQLLGWTVLTIPGIEADDVIGTLARAGEARGMQVVISSGDKDLAQLVTEHVTIIDTMSGKKRDLAGVQAEFGVPANRMIDYQTLVGDSVDNVPGVSKVGPKTAAKWLNEYGSLDALIAQADAVKGAAGENLRKALDWLPTGRQLVTIRTDCDLSPALNAQATGTATVDDPIHALPVRPADAAALAQFYEQYGFRSLAKSIAAGHTTLGGAGKGGRAKAGPAPETDLPAGKSEVGELRYTTILTWAQFDEWLARIDAAELTALDTEATSLDEMQATLVGISLSVQPGEAAYIPLMHTQPGTPEQLPLDEVLARLKPWLEDASKPKLGQNFKYDRHVFANHGMTVRGYVHDTMLASYVLEVHRAHSLESLADRHLGRTGLSYEDVCGKGVNQIPFAEVDLDTATRYACEDADQTLDVHRALWPRLAADERLRGIYALEIETSERLFRVERNGVQIDAGTLARQSNDLGRRILEAEEKAYELAGQPFKLGSPKQIGEILFGKLGIPPLKKTPSGVPSTDEDVLEQLAEDYPLPATILEHRSLSKLKSTYTDKLPQMASPLDGRVHTHYAQAVAVTGRLSSVDPNLQNIPVRTADGRRIREAFVAPPGRLIASADYSQIELRIMAHLSGDAALLKAFREGLDVHRATASEVFGVAPDQVSSEQRRYAKVINFGLIYGMSAFGLAKNLNIERSAAKSWIERYFERYPGVRRYMDDTVDFARSHGYVETVFGRRLYLPEINGGNGPRKRAAERQAINAPMQGTAADLIKKAMCAVQDKLDAQGRQTLIIMQVHDELVFEVPEAEVDWVREEVPQLMASVAELQVPLLAEVGVGLNWEEAH
ncbi:DNA polymerase I [Comamonas serinivorans]|uniref:DNA polymerase I n=1 Tax=Comamonas serinivorans TaxID=1082851 RepID=A0A1Y0EN47_9BURK|nr:DNA polymerase I [Comamonas serinivorans]ARU05016.1 DNA polymerase I [Comamonas serinivorans]